MPVLCRHSMLIIWCFALPAHQHHSEVCSRPVIWGLDNLHAVWWPALSMFWCCDCSMRYRHATLWSSFCFVCMRCPAVTKSSIACCQLVLTSWAPPRRKERAQHPLRQLPWSVCGPLVATDHTLCVTLLCPCSRQNACLYKTVVLPACQSVARSHMRESNSTSTVFAPQRYTGVQWHRLLTKPPHTLLLRSLCFSCSLLCEWQCSQSASHASSVACRGCTRP